MMSNFYGWYIDGSTTIMWVRNCNLGMVKSFYIICCLGFNMDLQFENCVFGVGYLCDIVRVLWKISGSENNTEILNAAYSPLSGAATTGEM